MRKLSMRLIALCLASMMVLGITSCTTTEPKETGEPRVTTQGDTLFDDSVEISIVISSFISWPYNEDWKFWQYFREAVGGKINVNAIPSTEYSTKVSLMMATPNQLPDLLHVSSKHTIDSFALSGPFVSVEDNLDKLPNYVKVWDSIPELERNNLLQLRLSGDGKTYFPQVYGTERMASNQTWMYRKDVFEKHSLKIPETMDDLYEVSLQLKTLYPDSYPFGMYNFNTLATIGPQWSPYFQHYVYYDFNSAEWKYGAAEQTMYDIVEYLIKMRKAELVASDFLTMTPRVWEELGSTDRMFIMPAHVVRIDTFNQVNRTRDPNYTWAAMDPPRANTKTGQNLIARVSPNASGYAVLNTRDQKRIDNAFKLVDWMYTDEATELLSWGKEGETYEMVEGNRKFILEDGENPTDKYGIFTSGLYQRIDPNAINQVNSEEQNRVLDQALKNYEEHVNPKMWMAFSDEEFTRRENVRSAIENYTDEMLSKFILGITPLSEWDSFQKTLVELDVEELLAVHESAYNRVLDAMD